MKKAVLFLLLVLPFLFMPVQAQEVAGVNTAVAQYVKIDNPGLKNGDIIVLENSTYRVSKKVNDAKIVGVYIDNPTVGVNYDKEINNKAIISSGVVLTRVSAENGPISKNDEISTSTIPGVGMKALPNSNILGTALVNYAPSNPNTVTVIPVLISSSATAKTTVKRTLFDIFTLSNTVITESPSTVFKYVVASIIVLVALALSFFTFSRIASNGIAALGRNPMASTKINAAILLNVLLALTIIVAGVFVAYLVILL